MLQMLPLINIKLYVSCITACTAIDQLGMENREPLEVAERGTVILKKNGTGNGKQ